MKTINKHKNQLAKQALGLALLTILLFTGQSCEKYLDVVPDNVVTIDDAFDLRVEAEKYLFTCYSYLPENGDGLYNIAHLAGDEFWIPPNDLAMDSHAFDIARGLQRNYDTYMDAWNGWWQGGGPGDLHPIWEGIRHCNEFLENVEDRSRVPDLKEAERLQWIAEVKFLKAYYHFYLLRMYGPIPIMDYAIDIDAPESELQVSRDPVDQVFNYIINLLDEAIVHLPQVISNSQVDHGRITKSIAAGVKADILLTAASPLFNGNSDMAGFNSANGTPFFNPSSDMEKWQKAADAALVAINTAESSGHSFYTFPGVAYPLNDTTELLLTISHAMSDRDSREVIWPNTQSRTYWFQIGSMWILFQGMDRWSARSVYAPTLKIAKQFYTKNGVPITEDKTLDFTDLNEVRTAGEQDKYYIAEGYRTARLNFDREPRFYADLAFDGSIYYLESSGANELKYHIEAKYSDLQGSSDIFNYNVTGYFNKKAINYKYNYVTFPTVDEYAWPELRLAELYLSYAEALNEVQGPVDEVFTYIDKVRERAGLNGVKESWDQYSNNPSKYTTKEGMRKIIQQERMIELALEGKRYWDLRRWKLAAEVLNEPVQGWNIYGKEETSYYQVNTIFQQHFIAPRDYFWPLSEYTLLQNPNLVQNIGW